MDVRLRELAAAQADIVAAWQLLAAGWTRRMIDYRVCHLGWRVVHRGVYALTSAPLTRRQLWFAATLTSPGTVLSHASAGACWGIREFEGSYETVMRPGTGGPHRRAGLLVCRTTTLDGDTTRRDGIRITTAARTMIDLAPQVSDREVGRMLREALRLRATTHRQLTATLERHRGRRGTALLAALAARYAALPYDRTRSNAEARALEVLHDAGVEPPATNVPVAREEADLVWASRRLIIEIDGPQYHRFRDEDARKEALWRDAGYTVRRVSSDDVFHHPDRLIAIAPSAASGRFAC